MADSSRPRVAMGIVKEYLQQAHTLQRDAFVAIHPEPVLIRQKDVESMDPRNEYRSTLKMKVDPIKKEVRVEPFPPSPTDSVFPLGKSERNTFASKVLVGRTETNDLVIQHLTVSKHHAYFRIDPDSSLCELVDTDSTNGTKLNGQTVAPKNPRELADGDQLSFGDMRFTFYTAGGFFDLLRSLSALR
ncbi:MAG TPA: FHA domain-containing protein [Myxococcota bacterium]|nr:FHA domain-containing protein [Myxococcota bacterium]